jgi:hypothetical protein
LVSNRFQSLRKLLRGDFENPVNTSERKIETQNQKWEIVAHALLILSHVPENYLSGGWVHAFNLVEGFVFGKLIFSLSVFVVLLTVSNFAIARAKLDHLPKSGSAIFTANIPGRTDTYEQGKSKDPSTFIYHLVKSTRKGGTSSLTSGNAALDEFVAVPSQPLPPLPETPGEQQAVMEFPKGKNLATIQFIQSDGLTSQKVPITVPKSGPYFISGKSFYSLAAAELADYKNALESSLTVARQEFNLFNIVPSPNTNIYDSRTDAGYKAQVSFMKTGQLVITYPAYTVQVIRPVAVTPKLALQD